MYEKLEGNYLRHERKVIVTVNDSDFHKEAKPSAIMGYFQDVAVEHAEILGLGGSMTREKNLAWILVRVSIVTARPPQTGECLSVLTFPEKPGSFDVNRGYYIFDERGELIVSGSSKWCVLDISEFKIQRCAPFFKDFDDASFIPSPPFEDANRRLKGLAGMGYTMEKPLAFVVQVSDLDQNYHVNNTRYGSGAEDSVNYRWRFLIY